MSDNQILFFLSLTMLLVCENSFFFHLHLAFVIASFAAGAGLHEKQTAVSIQVKRT